MQIKVLPEKNRCARYTLEGQTAAKEETLQKHHFAPLFQGRQRGSRWKGLVVAGICRPCDGMKRPCICVKLGQWGLSGLCPNTQRMFEKEAGASPSHLPFQAFVPGMLLFWHYPISSSSFPLFTQKACVSCEPLFKVKEHHNCQVAMLHYTGDKVRVKSLLRKRSLCFAPLLARDTEKRKGQGSKAYDKVQNMVLLVCFKSASFL